MEKPLAFLKIVPPIWYFAFLALASIAHFFFPATRIFDITVAPMSYFLGGVLLFVGFVLPMRASNLFAQKGTEILPTSPQNAALIVEGPYRWSRNPMYLGMVVMLLGIAIMIGTLPYFVAALADFVLLNFFFIPFEERKMARQFGDEYRAYKERVRRWI